MSVLPPATIGMLGGGQLGRMTALAASRLGYHTYVYEPELHGPASQVCEKEWNASFLDEEALKAFASSVDVISLEFENIPARTLQILEQYRPVHPHWSVLQTCQSREKEKTFLRSGGYPHAPFQVVTSAEELKQAVARLGIPCVLKSSEFGYDGKGQVKITSEQDLEKVWSSFGLPRGVVEAWVSFKAELSVICARRVNGEMTTFPVAENIHTNHILDFSIVPASFDQSILKKAEELARSITEKLGVVGLLAVEMFLTNDNQILVNELAPRSHNSGHYTQDACVTSQFEQHVRAICDLPLSSTELLRPVVMVNLLGDVWPVAGQPDWQKVLNYPQAKLHLYGKAMARPGRKMGHICVFGDSASHAFQQAKEIKNLLKNAH